MSLISIKGYGIHRGKLRDKMIAMVQNFSGWEIKKKWELRAGDNDLRLHLEGKGVSRGVKGSHQEDDHSVRKETIQDGL